MNSKISTSQAGQRLLSRVYQIISNTTNELDARQEAPIKETANQRLTLVQAEVQLYISDVNTLGEIFLANSRLQTDALFISNEFLRNVRDLKTLYYMLTDPKERKAFIENAGNQQATNVLSFPK